MTKPSEFFSFIISQKSLLTVFQLLIVYFAINYSLYCKLVYICNVFIKHTKMKNLLLLISITWLMIYSASSCEAQKSISAKDLNHYVVMMDTAESPASWKTISDQFAKLAVGNDTNWLVQYHAAFSHAIYAMRITDMKERDNYLDRAMAYAEKSDSAKPKESEIYVLKGMITAMKISVDPKRGMEMGQESSQLVKQGNDLNPENPRAYLEMGESAMYIPEQYGGGKKKSQAFLATAIAKYKTSKSEDINWPHWGESRAKMLLEKCKSL